MIFSPEVLTIFSSRFLRIMGTEVRPFAEHTYRGGIGYSPV